MSAPPVLRPLRAILQRRLQIVSSRPIRTPYYLRAPHCRSQLRYNSSIPPDQPPKPEESAQEASTEQTTENKATPTTTTTEGTDNATVKSPVTSASAPEVEDSASVVTNFEFSGRDAIVETVIPRLDSLLVKSAFQQLKSTDAEIQAGIAEALERQLAVDGATTFAVGEAEIEGEDRGAPVPVIPESTIQEVAEAINNQPEVVITQEIESTSLPVEAKTSSTVQHNVEPVAAEPSVAPNNAAPQQSAMPGLEALKDASPEHIAAMMAYLQTLQAAKSPAPIAGTTTSGPPVEQQKAPESAVSEATTPASSSAQAVATATQPLEPAQQEPDMPETPALETPTEDAALNTVEAENDFVVEPIPDTLSPEEAAVMGTTQEVERPRQEQEEVIDAESEVPFVTEPIESTATTNAPDEADTPELDVAAKHAMNVTQDEVPPADYSLNSVKDEELEKRDREEHAKELVENEEVNLEASGEASEALSKENLEPSRIPRNVAAYYLQPLRRVAEYGVPACDLQLRSYSVRPLESFCDFALRAAYYLGLPAYGPVPLPKIIERWTVPKSSFIFKKSQENFERITRRRMIQIKDAHPETVQIWLAFLQKHQQAAVGMKANIWEFSSIDVAKQMDNAFKEAESDITRRYGLLQQNKEFETVEKVDELLQSERYRLTGDQVAKSTARNTIEILITTSIAMSFVNDESHQGCDYSTIIKSGVSQVVLLSAEPDPNFNIPEGSNLAPPEYRLCLRAQPRPTPTSFLATQMFSRARIRPHCVRTLSQSSQATYVKSLPRHRHASSSSTIPSESKVIFSGIQPTGVPHLGNYLGALKSWVKLQDDAVAGTKLLYSVVDLHAITVPQQADALRQGRRGMLAAMLAVGLDPKRSVIFYQSSVPAHAELMWILSCTASMGYLSRMTQWKSKLSLSEDTSALDEKAKSSLKLGLFSYPVLQAADIMVHGATHVPVGEDQKQHIEFARECASNFNATYSKAILVPPEIILSPARRVMSLSKPTAKMSKSDPNPLSQILITDDAQQIRKKFMRSLTDSQSDVVSYNRTERPGVSNLLEILSILEGCTPTETAAQFEGMHHPLKSLKERTAEAVTTELASVGDKYRELMTRNNGEALDEIEALGAEQAAENANVTMRRVKEAVGL